MPQPSDSRRLFLIAYLTVFTIGLGFAVRAAIAGDLSAQLFMRIDPARGATMVGHALGMTFTGFAFTLLIGGALVDWMGSKRMLMVSALSNLGGAALVLLASLRAVDGASYPLVLAGLLLTGLGWGAVEAAINPLVVSVDPANKVKRLNVLHAWWPAGIVGGGLASLLIKYSGLPWQTNLLLLMAPAVAVLLLLRGMSFPVTERVAAGVSYLDMVRELARQPQFLLLWACMWLTASAELAPAQWVDMTLSRTVGMDGILILVYVSALMFVMRHFAGALGRHVSSIALLWWSCLLAAIGLYGLSLARTPLAAFAAATVWGCGVCYMWPTMLALVSERFPRGGALFLGLMGFGGGMAIEFLLPQLGRIMDQALQRAAGGPGQLASLTSGQLAEVAQMAAAESFQAIALVPLLLLPVFGAIWLHDRRTARGLSLKPS
ncbi:sugar MFS transporter [Duganella sp. BuS-21]|uniref:MFS transporter n=1 Tax=Duganella sp. BuS-21 TaxID=2943848 RepID=UPI0035A71934